MRAAFIAICCTIVALCVTRISAADDFPSIFSTGDETILVFSEPDTYSSVYKKSVETGQKVTVMYGNYSLEERLSASAKAAERGDLFYAAKPEDGFKNGIYRLFPASGQLYYESRLMVCDGNRCRP